ncbi:hypothetical protein [Dyella japonica]|uniref:Uncharacterized protein n=1 Tax=Dyella japonica A8 TaxID=1217721 RepID=A0A075K0A0_9GAMM|nr:hypothetical protein [Dyella japonica]AIF47212.1 hypothetical protein HY57_07940 [Dyella japonica A8]
MDDLIPVYSVLVGTVPMFVAAIVGIVMAGVYWARARKPALLLLVACVLQVLLILAQSMMTGWYIPHLMHEGTMSTTQLFITLWAVASSLLQAIALGLMIWAVFSGRSHAAPTPR